MLINGFFMYSHHNVYIFPVPIYPQAVTILNAILDIFFLSVTWSLWPAWLLLGYYFLPYQKLILEPITVCWWETYIAYSPHNSATSELYTSFNIGLQRQIQLPPHPQDTHFYDMLCSTWEPLFGLQILFIVELVFKQPSVLLATNQKRCIFVHVQKVWSRSPSAAEQRQHIGGRDRNILCTKWGVLYQRVKILYSDFWYLVDRDDLNMKYRIPFQSLSERYTLRSLSHLAQYSGAESLA